MIMDVYTIFGEQGNESFFYPNDQIRSDDNLLI